ncbi:MAG: AbrB/MazE/SpoVT family DNA-binding domain-containing protein [Gordonia sp.]|uniref:AbrB/MazE/SpoVT family DNA-binding domain-containing protein n=1 Tax=Gordonia sp. (in: high G+C Gram-positive bacteria) TaxID=84139 RepID=UPI001DEA2F24|nr:AbrB/MazE/SpoVT family DNA-binding domain-containing protein [Gordonia sp. (in: high G+C Gram-positive bacteria)]MCB1297053.1 AbrB/MazE/SpoVT family DNA-binding domain-containing protein [Gordonia sp. (in: high G+C Gram-positive bacteria)]HQV17567.1 AbrB/MazE/SpoVT family DNA-binding domain-containing protein [Gordonia sp. (in: high G+C Gram-positive bacteria)]
MSVTVTLGKQGRLVVPAELRTELGLGEGDVLHVQRIGRRIVLERPVDALRELRGIMTPATRGKSLVEELLADRIAEAEADKR